MKGGERRLGAKNVSVGEPGNESLDDKGAEENVVLTL
jgi:hypothetical protein